MVKDKQNKNWSNMIPYGRQEINQEDINSLINVLKSDFLTQGPRVSEFEKKVALKVGSAYSVAVNSATSALHIACLSLGLKRGDWLWTSPISFVASANCGLYCGANIDFVDIDSRTYNMSLSALEEKLFCASKKGKLPKVLVVVHLCGQSCDMENIKSLSEKYGFYIIEDASHAIGGKYKNKYVGNCQYSDIAVFSFHPVKIITTAEGGLAVTNNPKLAEKMRLYSSHGITRDQNMISNPSNYLWYYEQIELGYNYRMNELQAALGISQLDRLDEFVARRHQIASRYNKLLIDLPIVTPWQDPNTYSSFHLYVIRLNLEEIKKSHDEVFKFLRSKGIGVNLHYIPIYMQPYFRARGFEDVKFVEAEKYYSEAISLPIYYLLTDHLQDQVKSALNEILK